jgi:2-polyprenyl-3-methyl-5-hydroxy-6-metoxy-1,4-benzoquinol methylase
MSKHLFKSHQNPEGNRIEDGEEFNLTHLSSLKEWSRNRCCHRDMNAHNLRWQYVANFIFKNYKRDTCAILDVGCAPDWNLLVTCHSNGIHPSYYLGIDARDCSKTLPKVSFPTNFEQVNVVDGLPRFPMGSDENWDVVVCLEVLEHMPKESGLKLLANLCGVMGDDSVLIFSTPCYDPDVGMAESHIYEWKYEELKAELEQNFIIEDHFGTFASQKDYKHLLNDSELKFFLRLKEYYNSAWVANIMAPLYPDKSRNCLWILQKKQG